MRLLEYKTDKNIRAFSTYRGEGSGNYASFNITDYCGDTAEHVAECRELLCRHLGISDDALLLPRQTHGCGIICIDSRFMELQTIDRQAHMQGIDAIMTDLGGICIGVSTADCIPILLHDSTKGVIAAVHAGWRGTAAYIVQECIDAMRERYGCRTEEMKAFIGPGISLESFEVGDEVYGNFAEAGFPMKKIARRFPAEGGGEKWHIDLWEANRLQMIESGIDEGRINVSGICTYMHHNEFFSARRLGISSGRIFSGIMRE